MMSETALDQKSGSTSWLLADSPKNAFQAKCQRAYIGWMSFRSNPIAMFGLAIVLFLCFVALFAPLIAGGDGTTQDLANRLAPPSAEHWFGTDELGRDIFARIVWGARTVASPIPYAEAGLVFAAVAGMLNILAMLDVYGYAVRRWDAPGDEAEESADAATTADPEPAATGEVTA